MIFEKSFVGGLLSWALYPVRRVTNWCTRRSTTVLYGVKYAAKRAFVCVGLFVVILWIAIFLYASFYHVFVPSASIHKPAHFKFRVCPSGAGMCSFPMANVTLCSESKAEILGRGQQYQVFLELQVPDSKANRDVGLFMVISRIYDRYGVITQESSRAVSLKYQSDLLKTIQTILLSPLYIAGFAEQTQTLNIELYDEFWDDYYQPSVGVLLEIHSRHLSFYSAQLQLYACYTGFRYYLFYYPLISAFFGVAFNCLWLAVVFTLTWYRLGMELLDGLAVKALSSGDRTGEERVDRQITGDEGEVRMIGGGGQLDLEFLDGEQHEVETVPRKTLSGGSSVQPFMVAATPRPAENVTTDAGGANKRADSLSLKSGDDTGLHHRSRSSCPI